MKNLSSLFSLHNYSFWQLQPIFVSTFWCTILILLSTLHSNFNEAASLRPPQEGLLVLLHPQTKEQATQTLIFDLNQHPLVLKVDFQSKEQALAEIETALGLEDILAFLPDNPLPANLFITPVSSASNTELAELIYEIESWPTVSRVTQTGSWLLQYSTYHTSTRSLFKLSFLICSVGLVFSALNRIALITNSQKDEISLQAIMGATWCRTLHPYLGQMCLYTLAGYGLALLLGYLLFHWTWPLVNDVTSMLDLTLPGKFLSPGQSLILLALALILVCLGTSLAFIKYRSMFKGEISW